MSAAQDLVQENVDACCQQVGQGVFHGPEGSITQLYRMDELRTPPHFDVRTMFGRIATESMDM